MKILRLLVVALWISAAHAGSYDDWFVAVKQDDPQVIAGLLQRGFDPDTISPNGVAALYMALQEGSLKVADTLIAWPKTRVEWRTRKDESPLMIAALKGHEPQVRKLIERGADVNKTGWAPLHYAATGGHVKIIDLLLEHHAYIDAESPNKSTPLMMAAMYGSPEAVKLLLESGADPTLRNDLGMTALDFAHRGGRPDAIEMIAAAVRAKAPRGKW